MAFATPTADIGAGFALGREYVRLHARKLLNILVFLWILSGGFVLFEPSPYEVMFLLVLPVACVAAINIYRSTLPLLVLFVLFIPFALTAAFRVRFNEVTDSIIYQMVTAFLILTAYFVANFVANAPQKHMRLIMKAYTIIAVIAALIGTLAYLGILPGEDVFTKYGRAKATFNDPNVYGPFLVLPAMYALQRVFFGRGKRVIWSAGIFMVLFIGVFASFSRGAWMHYLASSLLVFLFCFFLEARAVEKVRMLMLSLVGLFALVVALGGLLSIPAVSALFETRAHATQEYDTGDTGRFGRQGYAADLALNNPLGIGPLEFRNLRIAEEPHNVYVNVMHAYGWGGGLCYYALVLLTLWRGLSVLAKPGPNRLLLIPIMATYLPLIGESAIIDSDHWRHYYLVTGLVWGVATGYRTATPDERKRLSALI